MAGVGEIMDTIEDSLMDENRELRRENAELERRIQMYRDAISSLFRLHSGAYYGAWQYLNSMGEK